MPPPTRTTIRPLERFAKSVAKCTPQASEYGKCIVADYNNVHKDKCLAQFMRLKECVVDFKEWKEKGYS
ncbi:hypothetical protein DFH27DRAFT_209933 [Peziza echinospora]|nr:hypothetical protein DFH27DRAFT_209933 [Peziza echinospora]